MENNNTTIENLKHLKIFIIKCVKGDEDHVSTYLKHFTKDTLNTFIKKEEINQLYRLMSLTKGFLLCLNVLTSFRVN